MKVSPISAAEAIAPGILKRGGYDFEVETAIEKTSKANNEMIELMLKVYDTDGKYRMIRDWLVETEGMAYKTRHFAEAVNMLTQYNNGELKGADLIGKTGRCQVGIRKDKTGAFPDENNIQDYLPAGAKSLVSSVIDDMDDDIPF